MGTTAANSATSTSNIAEDYFTNLKSDRKTGELGKDDFLELLVTQLQYQDPLDPQDNSEFISQMAQFTSLEQMQNMNTSMTSAKAYGMIGKMVAASTTDSKTGKVSYVSGLVDSVKMTNGEAVLMVNGKEVKIEDVAEVTNSTDSQLESITALAGIIGKNVKALAYDAATGSVVKVDGVVAGTEMGTDENYVVLNGVKAEVSSIEDSTYSSATGELAYLREHIGEKVSMYITDSSGAKVPVKATVKSVTKNENGDIIVELDGLAVPAAGIYGMSS